VYAPDGDPAHTLINRAEERVAILRDLAQRLLRDYQGPTLTLLAACEGQLQTPEGSGFLDRLSKIEGYNDRHFKKAFVLLKFLGALDLWRSQDTENLFIPVGYHLIRMALRTGMVTVTDSELAEQLHERSSASEAGDWKIRQVAKHAYKVLEERSEIGVFLLDEIFWTVGCSCCHYDRPTRTSIPPGRGIRLGPRGCSASPATRTPPSCCGPPQPLPRWRDRLTRPCPPGLESKGCSKHVAETSWFSTGQLIRRGRRLRWPTKTLTATAPWIGR